MVGAQRAAAGRTTYMFRFPVAGGRGSQALTRGDVLRIGV